VEAGLIKRILLKGIGLSSIGKAILCLLQVGLMKYSLNTN